MGVKISQLASLSEITSQDVLIINHNSATYQGDLDTIIGGYLDNASYINASNFSDYLFSGELSLGYFSSFVTQDYLSAQSYISYNDLFGGSEGTGGYLDNYITSEYCSSYITSGYLSEYLSSYCSGYITSEYLLNASYMTYSDLENNFTDLMNSGYLSDSDNAYKIYTAISSYFNT